MRATKTIVKILAVLVVIVLQLPIYVRAEINSEIDLTVDFQPVGNNDDIVNRADEAAYTNLDSWDPEPQGVWVGGWTPESLFRMNEVPDTDCSLALASVVRFSSNVIMSGASQLIVRLPIRTGNWTHGLVNVYHIDETTNWTFTNNDRADCGRFLDYLYLNFTTGTHQLIAWSREIGPNDLSPTDGNDHYTRTERTFVELTAPILPDEFYLFVATFWYDSDEYIEFYIEPDSLSMGLWNRSTVALFNRYEPDLYNLEVHNYNVSLGWSFDMRVGYGNSGACWQHYIYTDDVIDGIGRLNKNRINQSDYITWMLPFWCDQSNLSLMVSIDLVIPGQVPRSWNAIASTDEWSDFVLLSSSDNVSTILGNASNWNEWDGWITFSITFGNDTRFRFFMRDIPDGYNYWNETWDLENPWGDMLGYVWDSDMNWDATRWFLYDQDLGGGAHSYSISHFRLDYALQTTSYKWTKTGAPAAQVMEPPPEPHPWTKSFFWTASWFLLGMVFNVFIPGGGFTMATTVIDALYRFGHALRDTIYNYLQDKLDWIRDGLQTIGDWLWKVGQAIVTVLRWVIETIVYYGSIILGILLFILAFVVLFVPMWATLKIAMAFRKALFGDIDGAAGELKGIVSAAASVSKRIPGGG